MQVPNIVQKLVAAVANKISAYDKVKRDSLEKTARMLTGDQSIKLRIVRQVGTFPASYDIHSHVMQINELEPNIGAGNPALQLIMDRAKVYHECGHVLWTKDPAQYRKSLALQANDVRMFMALSNILEDGRIEWLMEHCWKGAKRYLNAMVHYFARKYHDGTNPEDSLILFVRFGKFPAHSAYWAPVLHLINKAIRSHTTRESMKLALEIVNILVPNPAPNPTNPEPPEGEGEPQEGEPDGEGEGEGEAQEGEGEGESGKGKAPEGGKGKAPEKSDEEGDEAGKDKGAGDCEDFEQFVNDLFDEALNELSEEAEKEHSDLTTEAQNLKENQSYRYEGEEADAEMLSQILGEIKADRMREVWTPAEKYGRIDGSSLGGIVTGDSFMEIEEETPQDINVAIAIDCSGSMMGDEIKIALSCGRILNGALQKAGINSRAVMFGTGSISQCDVLPQVPNEDSWGGGGTPTAEAMRAAHDWFKTQEGKGLLMIVTDGAPNSREEANMEYRNLSDDGHVIVGILINAHDGYLTITKNYCHHAFVIQNANELRDIMQREIIQITAHCM